MCFCFYLLGAYIFKQDYTQPRGTRHCAYRLRSLQKFNDTFGHDVGDEVLKGIANILAPLNDEGQVAARYGGEEFAIAKRVTQPNDNQSSEAEEFAKQLEALHCAINKLTIASIDDRKLGACIGWTLCKGSDDIVEAFRRADKALYVAKDKGRNLIIPAL